MLTTKITTSKWLRSDAAASFARMVAAAGTSSGLVAAGRTRAEQQVLYDLYLTGKGNLAAKPGTSLHESGLAIDVTRRSPLQLWMVHGSDPMKVTKTGTTRAAAYGWYRTVPSEAWHFSYDPARDTHRNDKAPGSKPVPVPTLARVATFNCGAWGKTTLSGKQIDALYGVLTKLNASIYSLTECPEWLRNHLRGLCKCPTTVKAGGHRRLDAGRWRVRARGSQAILRDSKKWASGPWQADEFGPTSYHGWLIETLTQTTTGARLAVGCYHLPPNTVASQDYQKSKLRGFLAELPSGSPRLVGGDGVDETVWASGWDDARTAAKDSENRGAPTYQKRAITDRIHTKGITVRRYTVVPAGGASDHDAVLAQITIPATKATN